MTRLHRLTSSPSLRRSRRYQPNPSREFLRLPSSPQIDAQLIGEGNVIDFADVLIAGIARLHDETLVTRNDKHFRRKPEFKLSGTESKVLLSR